MDITYIIQQTIIYMIPLLIVALGGVFAERSGIINLALDGEMIFGAFIGAIFCSLMTKGGYFDIQTTDAGLRLLANQGLFVLCMLVSMVSGFLLSLLLSFAAIKMKADQTIIGTALNNLAPAIVCAFGLLFFGNEKIRGNGNFVLIAQNYNPDFQKAVMENPVLNFLFDKTYISTYIVIILFVFLSIWLYKSKTGTHLRACGENPHAADSVGINVGKMRLLGTSISGALAGLGGFVYIATAYGTTAESQVGGLGFLALAIMIFGNWNPFLIFLGALFFGFLKSLGILSSSIPFLSKLELPMYFYNIIPYFLVIVVLIIGHKKSGCPKAEGIPYDKGKR